MNDHANMRAAIEEARRASGPCHPNPAVGAVVMHRGGIVARGCTQSPGGDHAEVVALKAFQRTGYVPDDSTILYVTLEPCCTHGRTPPCTERIIESGIRRVIVGATDPNPLHTGKGFEILRAAGIYLEHGICESECTDLNLVFNHWIQRERPLFAAKIATTLDGRIATRSGHSQWITSEAARQDVAAWRRAFPAIAVGAGTVLKDDPQLTARLPGEAVWCPWRLIFDRAGLCLEALERRVFVDEWAARTIYLTSDRYRESIPVRWREHGVQVWTCADWTKVREQCLASGITGVYVEGGPRLLADLLQARQLDYLFAYRAPKWLADSAAPGPFAGFAPETMSRAFQLRDVRLDSFGSDQLMRGYIVYPEPSEA